MPIYRRLYVDTSYFIQKINLKQIILTHNVPLQSGDDLLQTVTSGYKK